VELHLLSPVTVSPTPERGRFGGAMFVSTAVHAVMALLIGWFAYYSHVREVTEVEPEIPQRIVWVAMPGPSGGGGGSPAKTPPPPKLTPPEAKKTPEAPAPVVIPTEITPPAPEPAEPQPVVAAVADASSSGATNTSASAPGNGRGNGAGPGDGDGAGPGEDKGFGGGAYRPGNGVTSPFPTTRAQPRYTDEAVRARAQGVITVECVVEPNGQCGDVRIARAFAPTFGLERQALEAARRWRFRPGMRDGQPVPVLVNLEIEFNIR
jgi:periplasmic protein TonB